ncbi:MAG: class I adenylate-forming enzyme family protein [Dehalococcoidia bacterium]
MTPPSGSPTPGNSTSGYDPAAPLNLARACLEHWATDPAHAARPAFTFIARDGDLVFTFADVWERVQRIGRGLLAAGLVPGDRILVRLPHSPDYAFAFLGAAVAGLVPIPANPTLTPEEAAFLLEDADAAALVCTDETRIAGFDGLVLGPADLATMDGSTELPVTRADDPAYLIYTSGSTARPKGVLHAHRTVLARRLMREAWQGFGPSDRVLHAGTLNWSYTLGVGLLDAWAAGAHAHLAEQPFEASRWPEEIERHRVTVFVAVPTVYRQMLKYGQADATIGRARLASLRHGLCAGEPLRPALLDDWRAHAGTELYESLGMTEISTYISTAPGMEIRPGSAGRPQPGRRVAILRELPEDPGHTDGVELPRGEVGLLAVHRSDPGLMLGYWRRPAEEAEVMQGEWFVGGDLASMDADGYVWFAGRADDIIKSFGLRLSPIEIETELSHHPAVQEVAAVGLELDPTKTLLAVAVVPHDPAALTEAELREYAGRHLAGYKQPHLYRFVDQLPRTRNGKIQRRVLAERLIEEIRSESGSAS